MKKKLLFIMFSLLLNGLCFYPRSGSGQEEILTDMIQTTEETEQASTASEIAEALIDVIQHPVSINRADRAEIDAIPLLNPMQSRNLFDYIYTYGEVLSLYELQVVPGFDSALIQQISPFIIIEPVSGIPRFTLSSFLKRSRHELVGRIGQVFPVAAGYRDTTQVGSTLTNRYQGSPQRLYFRYTCSWFDRIRIGFAGDKDPGEEFGWNQHSKGFDFYAGYVSVGNAGMLKQLVIGHYKAQFGQGLTLATGGNLISGPGFTTAGFTAEGFRPTLSTTENHYLRGAAITLAIKKVSVNTFVSYHPRDARLQGLDSTESSTWISSLLNTGYHRTTNELLTRKAVKELVCGGNISASFSPSQQLGFKIGTTALYTCYSLPLLPEEEPYRKFSFRGDNNLNAGVDFRMIYRGLFLAGEYSMSRNGGRAFILSGAYQPDHRFSFTAIYRNYQPRYQGLHAKAFGRNGSNSNEAGLFTHIRCSLHPTLSVNCFADICSFPWVKYRVDAPSKGLAWGVEALFDATGYCRITARISGSRSEINDNATERNLHRTMEQVSTTIRYAVDFEPVPALRLRTQADARVCGRMDGTQPWGYLLSQDARISLLERRLSLAARFAMFDIPDYDTRIYIYEPDVRYGFAVPSFQDKGVRGCMVITFAVTKSLDMNLRGGITWYKGKESTGNGNDETAGPARGDFTAQFLFRM